MQPQIDKLDNFKLQGVGNFLAFVVTVAMKNEDVIAMLPDELELIPQDFVPSGSHTVIFEFGNQTDVGVSLNGQDPVDWASLEFTDHGLEGPQLSHLVDVIAENFGGDATELHQKIESDLKKLGLENSGLADLAETLFDNLAYLESAVLIPDLRYKNSTDNQQEPYIFGPKVFVNKLEPLILGIPYGFAKEFISTGMDQTNYIVNQRSTGDAYISGAFKATGNFGPPSDFPLFNKFMPGLLSQTGLGEIENTGIFACSDFKYDFDRFQLQALEVDRVQIHKQFLPGLMPQVFSTPSINTDPLGAFILNSPWTISLPWPCGYSDSAKGVSSDFGQLNLGHNHIEVPDSSLLVKLLEIFRGILAKIAT